MRQLFAEIVMGVALVLVAPVAVAQETGLPLRLEGVTVLHLRASAGGYTPDQRLVRLQHRFAEMVRRADLQPRDVAVEVGPDERTATVWAGRLLFVTATEADAQANDTQTPERLARQWAKRLRNAFERARRDIEP